MMEDSMRVFEAHPSFIAGCEFSPHPWLRNAHAMTVAGALWPRRARRLPAGEARRFEVEAGTSLLAKCHWQAGRRERATLVVVHGLEGSSESGYMRGLAELAFAAGLNGPRAEPRACRGGGGIGGALFSL